MRQPLIQLSRTPWRSLARSAKEEEEKTNSPFQQADFPAISDLFNRPPPPPEIEKKIWQPHIPSPEVLFVEELGENERSRAGEYPNGNGFLPTL